MKCPKCSSNSAFYQKEVRLINSPAQWKCPMCGWLEYDYDPASIPDRKDGHVSFPGGKAKILHLKVDGRKFNKPLRPHPSRDHKWKAPYSPKGKKN